MQDQGSVVVIGGTSGLGKEVARHYADQGREVVISGRDAARTAAMAGEIGGRTRGIGLDLTRPEEIEGKLAGLGKVSSLVIAAIDRDENSIRDYHTGRAAQLTILKLVGYPEVVHALASRLEPDGSVLMFGGIAKVQPYPGSTTVTTVNGGVSTLLRSLAVELAPIRVNVIHPGIVGDSPYWSAKPPGVLEAVRAKTPTGRLVAMQDIVHAVAFILENPSVNGTEVTVDGGRLLL
jgi:NAD(P)-dependent dehydrogenase (short-subunit alcohol dehydrogenase family)